MANPRWSRREILGRLDARLADGEPLLIGGAGIGLVAKALDAAQIDLLMVYNTGPFRMDGHGSLAGYLAYGDSNAMTLTLLEQLAQVVQHVPLIAGIGAADPYRDPIELIDVMIRRGASGVTNVPTAGLYDGTFRRHIDDTRLGYPREVELVRACRERDVFTLAYAFTPDEAAQMASAGADVVGAHVGLTTGGMIGATSAPPLDEAIAATQRMVDAARTARDGVIVVAHGGPFEDVGSVRDVYEHTDVDGYLGASSIERIPIERALQETVDGFRKLRLRQPRFR